MEDINFRGKKKAVQRVEKAILIHKQLRFDYDLDGGKQPMNMSVSVFVPKAKRGKPCPKIALTIDSGWAKLRSVSGDTRDLINLHLRIAAFLEENEATLERILKEEQEKWYKDVMTLYKANTNQVKILPLTGTEDNRPF